MIYSQTPLHNGLVRVSIKADGDGATLTFLDTQWSAALSVPPSYLHSLHLFHISTPLPYALPQRCTHASSHHSTFSLFTFFSFNITHSSKDSQQIFCQFVQLWICNSRTDTQHHNSGDGPLYLELTSPVLRLSVSAY